MTLKPLKLEAATKPLTPFEQWEAGELTNMEILPYLLSDLGEAEAELEVYQKERDAIRNLVSQVVARFDKPVILKGFGRLEITQPSLTKGYDRAALDRLLDDLIMEAPEIAQRLARCKTETPRAGSLRITREKGSK